MIREFIIVIIGCILGVFSMTYFAYNEGQKNKEKEIIKRALQINKDCYNQTDLDIIIFNESQL